MLVELLQTICTDLGWTFSHGSEYEQNLQDISSEDSSVAFEDKTKILGLEPNLPKNEFNKHGGLESKTYSKFMVLGVSADYGQDSFAVAYEERIKKLEVLVDSLSTKLVECNQVQILNWKLDPVIGLYDVSLDGIKIEFTIKILNR